MLAGRAALLVGSQVGLVGVGVGAGIKKRGKAKFIQNSRTTFSATYVFLISTF